MFQSVNIVKAALLYKFSMFIYFGLLLYAVCSFESMEHYK